MGTARHREYRPSSHGEQCDAAARRRGRGRATNAWSRSARSSSRDGAAPAPFGQQHRLRPQDASRPLPALCMIGEEVVGAGANRVRVGGDAKIALPKRRVDRGRRNTETGQYTDNRAVGAAAGEDLLRAAPLRRSRALDNGPGRRRTGFEQRGEPRQIGIRIGLAWSHRRTERARAAIANHRHVEQAATECGRGFATPDPVWRPPMLPGEGGASEAASSTLGEEASPETI